MSHGAPAAAVGTSKVHIHASDGSPPNASATA
jgi:hypothetical protein